MTDGQSVRAGKGQTCIGQLSPLSPGISPSQERGTAISRGISCTSVLLLHTRPQHTQFLQRGQAWGPWWKATAPYLSRGSSQRGSSGSSYSETPANIGVPLEESREGRTRRTPEFMEALESADTCKKEWGHPSSKASRKG